MRRKQGIFISFEKTGEGLGGSLQASLLVEALKRRGVDAMYTYQPGDTEIGEQLRQIVKHSTVPLSKATELFLFMADRAQHYKEKLKPALKAGRTVVCDRWKDSTLVYQGNARGWRKSLLMRLHRIGTGLLEPDLTFVLDGTPHRARHDDRFEREGAAFYRAVREGMLELSKSSKRYVVLHANQPVEELALQVMQVVEERFPEMFQTSEY